MITIRIRTKYPEEVAGALAGLCYTNEAYLCSISSSEIKKVYNRFLKVKYIHDAGDSWDGLPFVINYAKADCEDFAAGAVTLFAAFGEVCEMCLTRTEVGYHAYVVRANKAHFDPAAAIGGMPVRNPVKLYDPRNRVIVPWKPGVRLVGRGKERA